MFSIWQNRSFSHKSITRYAGTIRFCTNMTHTNTDGHTLHNNRIQCTLFVLEKSRKPSHVAEERRQENNKSWNYKRTRKLLWMSKYLVVSGAYPMERIEDGSSFDGGYKATELFQRTEFAISSRERSEGRVHTTTDQWKKYTNVSTTRRLQKCTRRALNAWITDYTG